jgi:hypothetical protein
MNVALPSARQVLATNGMRTDVIDEAKAEVMPSPSARIGGTGRFCISHYPRTSARTLPADFGYGLWDDTKRTPSVPKWHLCVVGGFSGLNDDHG